MVELAVIKLTRPETAIDLESLLSRIEKVERGSPVPPVSPTCAECAPHPAYGGTPPSGRGHREGKRLRLSPPEGGVARRARRGRTPSPTADGELTMERVQEVWPTLFGSLATGARSPALGSVPGGDPGSRRGPAVDSRCQPGLSPRGTCWPIRWCRPYCHPSGRSARRHRRGWVLAKAGETSLPVEEEIELDQERLFEAPAEVLDPTALLERELGATVVEDDPE